MAHTYDDRATEANYRLALRILATESGQVRDALLAMGPADRLSALEQESRLTADDRAAVRLSLVHGGTPGGDFVPLAASGCLVPPPEPPEDIRLPAGLLHTGIVTAGRLLTWLDRRAEELVLEGAETLAVSGIPEPRQRFSVLASLPIEQVAPDLWKPLNSWRDIAENALLLRDLLRRGNLTTADLADTTIPSPTPDKAAAAAVAALAATAAERDLRGRLVDEHGTPIPRRPPPPQPVMLDDAAGHIESERSDWLTAAVAMVHAPRRSDTRACLDTWARSKGKNPSPLPVGASLRPGKDRDFAVAAKALREATRSLDRIAAARAGGHLRPGDRVDGDPNQPSQIARSAERLAQGRKQDAKEQEIAAKKAAERRQQIEAEKAQEDARQVAEAKAERERADAETRAAIAALRAEERGRGLRAVIPTAAPLLVLALSSSGPSQSGDLAWWRWPSLYGSVVAAAPVPTLFGAVALLAALGWAWHRGKQAPAAGDAWSAGLRPCVAACMGVWLFCRPLVVVLPRGVVAEAQEATDQLGVTWQSIGTVDLTGYQAVISYRDFNVFVRSNWTAEARILRPEQPSRTRYVISDAVMRAWRGG